MILYISSNDGSDGRINKELRTLSSKTEIIYVGVGTYSNVNFAKNYCKKFHLINGKRNTILTMVRQFSLILWILLTVRIKTIHILNEQLMVFFYPLMFTKYVVLDLFDSIFLTWNRSGERWRWIKYLIYLPCNKIIVTDENRKSLMPRFTHRKICVLENYPLLYNGPWKKRSFENNVTIFYNGAMHVNRGTLLLEKLVSEYPNIKLILAGWLTDEATERFSRHPSVDWRGIITREESMRVAACESDYIMCMYAPVHENNINASPNKLYDSIQSMTPVITNADIVIAEFVRQFEIGIIFDNFQIGTQEFAESVMSKKNKFSFSESLRTTYIWEQVEQNLLKAHKL